MQCSTTVPCTSSTAGDEVVAHCLNVEPDSPNGATTRRSTPSTGSGLETNFGSLAEITLSKASELMPKVNHLTGEKTSSQSG